MAAVLKFQQNTKKFKELILYISERCANDPNFGAVKLNKILFLSDFWAYGQSGDPITGFEYIKLPNGPAPRRLVPIREQMIRNGELAIQEIALNPEMARKRPVNLRQADLSVFSPAEVSLVDQVIDICKHATATRVSEYTHNWHGWIAARDQETIPYETVFISDTPITPFERARGKELAAHYGWPV